MYDYSFLSFFLQPTSPSKPEPRRSMAVGSGTGSSGTKKMTTAMLEGSPAIITDEVNRCLEKVGKTNELMLFFYLKGKEKY